MFLGIALKYIIISLVICLLYLMNGLSVSIIKKSYNKDFKDSYLFQFWALVFFLIIWLLDPSKLVIFEVDNLWSWSTVLLILMAVIPTSIIASEVKDYKPKSRFKVKDFLGGASMEIPQRLLVQNLFLLLGVNSLIYGLLRLDIVLTAVIWVQFIILQEVINSNKISKKIIIEVFASFWFSIWVGILYLSTGNILVAMLTHGLQRMTTYRIRMRYKEA